MCFFLLYLPNPYAFSSKSYMLKLVRIHVPILSATFILVNNLVTNYRNYLGSTGVHVLQLHIKESLHNLVNTDPKRQQCAVFFRIVHAPIFLCFFASDRRHMKDPAGNWIAEPPSYEPIVAEGKHYDLMQILAVNFKAMICSNRCQI
ncbi:hypothetical protein Q3G72_007683 [Acer saccharum]|nr:hypothetical protein Q3G72_007683 [Acer saccharum]